MQSSGDTSRPLPLYTGIATLTAVLVNRLFLTPLDALPPPQSREDILAVGGAAALILYGLGRADVAEKKAEVVALEGVEFSEGMEGSVGWACRALILGVPAVRSFVFVVDGQVVGREGVFREGALVVVPGGGIVDEAVRKGERAYLADMKVVPVKEVEFGYLPENVQVFYCC